MAGQVYPLNFKGYWREAVIGGMPRDSGVYCVYACTHDPVAKTVSLKKLLYIGEAENVRERVAAHDRGDDWRRQLSAGQEICFSAATVGAADRHRTEAALIFKHKPPMNVQYKDVFPFDRTGITISGNGALLVPSFAIERTPKRLTLLR